MSGTLADRDVYVIYNTSSSVTISASGDITWGFANWNGDDAVGLAKDISRTFTLIDAVGTDGSDPGSEWSVAGTSNAIKDKQLLENQMFVHQTLTGQIQREAIQVTLNGLFTPKILGLILDPIHQIAVHHQPQHLLHQQ